MKSKDPEFRIPVDKESFRCNSCDYVVLNTTGGWNEVEPGLAFMVCDECYKPKKDPKKIEGADASIREEKDSNQSKGASAVCDMPSASKEQEESSS